MLFFAHRLLNCKHGDGGIPTDDFGHPSCTDDSAVSGNNGDALHVMGGIGDDASLDGVS